MKEIKTHWISFRVTENLWQEIEEAARNAESDPNEWVRKLVIANLPGPVNLTKNERVIFEEIARTRMMITHGFMMLAKQELTAREWKEIVDLTKKHSAKIGDKFLAQQPTGETI